MKKTVQLLAVVFTLMVISSWTSHASEVYNGEGEVENRCRVEQDFLWGICFDDTEGRPACIRVLNDQNCTSSW